MCSDVKLCAVIITTQAEVINYKGDLDTPPDQAEKKKKTNFVGKKIKMGRGKGAGADDSSDENDW